MPITSHHVWSHAYGHDNKGAKLFHKKGRDFVDQLKSSEIKFIKNLLLSLVWNFIFSIFVIVDARYVIKKLPNIYNIIWNVKTRKVAPRRTKVKGKSFYKLKLDTLTNF
jgi:hypothetical protein